jgi:hypothetical protein
MMRCALTGRRIGGRAGAPAKVGRCRAGPRWGLRCVAQACAGLGGCGGRGDPPGSAGHQPAAFCWRRRGMAGQEHHSAGEGNGSGRYQRRMPAMPRQCADPPRAGGGPVTRHRTGTSAQCPHAPPCAVKPGGVTVATRCGTKRRIRTSQAAQGAGNATPRAAVHGHGLAPSAPGAAFPPLRGTPTGSRPEPGPIPPAVAADRIPAPSSVRDDRCRRGSRHRDRARRGLGNHAHSALAAPSGFLGLAAIGTAAVSVPVVCGAGS